MQICQSGEVGFATLNKVICNDVNVKFVHLLSVDTEQHYVIESTLTHCATKVALQMPHGRKTAY